MRSLTEFVTKSCQSLVEINQFRKKQVGTRTRNAPNTLAEMVSKPEDRGLDTSVLAPKFFLTQ